MPIMVNWPLMKRKDGSRVAVKLNSVSVQWRTARTFSWLRLLMVFDRPCLVALSSSAAQAPEGRQEQRLRMLGGRERRGGSGDDHAALDGSVDATGAIAARRHGRAAAAAADSCPCACMSGHDLRPC